MTGGAAPRTVAVFQSEAFNRTEARDYFVNPDCFGDDLARWLIERLRADGVATAAEPGQEDWGWYFDFVVEGLPHLALIGLRPGDEKAPDEWLLILERRGGLRGLVLGGRFKTVAPQAATAMHRALAGQPEIRDLRWHDKGDFDAGIEDRGADEPLDSGRSPA